MAIVTFEDQSVPKALLRCIRAKPHTVQIMRLSLFGDRALRGAPPDLARFLARVPYTRPGRDDGGITVFAEGDYEHAELLELRDRCPQLHDVRHIQSQQPVGGPEEIKAYITPIAILANLGLKR